MGPATRLGSWSSLVRQLSEKKSEVRIMSSEIQALAEFGYVESSEIEELAALDTALEAINE